MSHRRKQALGRGLGALLGAPANPEPAAAEAVAEAAPGLELLEIPIASIRPNPRQPRAVFDPERLDELSRSIAEHGVLQPILVTRDPDAADGFILLAGERRLRASEAAGLDRLPARVVAASDVERLELALIENVQRDNLNPVEEARAYEALINSFGYTQEQVAKRVGKNRVTISNALRLLKLTDNCLEDLEAGRLTAGHARAILMLPHPLQQEMLRKEILDQEFTVRQAEARARRLLDGDPEARTARKAANSAKNEGQQDLDLVALQERLTVRLGCRVGVTARSARSGSIQIHYSSLDDLDRVLGLLGVSLDDH